MSILMRRDFVSSCTLLKNLIENPRMPEIVRLLSPHELSDLIDKVGVEDCGEIVSLASSEQLIKVFDMDLWRREKAGEDDSFCSQRFLLWLEILLEAGENALVTRLSEMPEDLLIAAFNSLVLVLNMDDLQDKMADRDDDEARLFDKALTDCAGEELDEYFIIPKQADGWDVLRVAIVSLYDREHDLLERILSKCCYASWEYIEDNGGLYDVLTAEEMLESDAAADRADRLSKQGYVLPSDATAFIRLAQISELKDLLFLQDKDPVTKAYFRNIDPIVLMKKNNPLSLEGSQQKGFALLLNAADPDVLPSATENDDRKQQSYKEMLQKVIREKEDSINDVIQSLVYLSNIIHAKFGSSDMPIRPIEAIQTVFEVIDVVFRHQDMFLSDQQSADNLETELCYHSPIKLFMAGWNILSKHSNLNSIAAVKQASDIDAENNVIK